MMLLFSPGHAFAIEGLRDIVADELEARMAHQIRNASRGSGWAMRTAGHDRTVDTDRSVDVCGAKG